VGVRSCGKRYGSGTVAVDALTDVDLEVWPGEFVVILGPSGSGKTTLLNLIGGIEPASSGAVMVAGTDIGTLDDTDRTTYRRERVGFVFQFFNLVPTLTALENVQLLAEATGRDAEARSRAALARVGLGEEADRFPAELSVAAVEPFARTAAGLAAQEHRYDTRWTATTRDPCREQLTNRRGVASC
jgi:putative ABC transport system ATP-binding protein